MKKKIENFKFAITLMVVVLIIMAKSCIMVASTIKINKTAKTDLDAFQWGELKVETDSIRSDSSEYPPK